MGNFWWGGLTFVLVYLIYVFTVIKRKKKLDKFIRSNTQLKYLKEKYNLKLNNISKEEQAHIIAFTNAIIMGIAITAVGFVSKLVWKLLLAFVVMFPLILLSYYILGKLLKKREDKNV